jgi:hypothetical protein
LQTNSQTVALERFPPSSDTNSATNQTVKLMCRYIKEAAADPVLKDAAAYVRNAYAGASTDPGMLAWGVFWFAKHNIKFVVDEAPLMRLERIVPGSGYAQQDLLIRPDVLIRMNPREGDCDDFTMMVCALLKCLGVPFSIVTIACGPDDPKRWSHVFPIALTPTPIAVDASHGRGPGWMVPLEQTYRWQAWDENGEPINLKRPGSQLHGWVRSSHGLGQGCIDADGNPIDCPSEISNITPLPPVTETPYPILQDTTPSPSTSGAGFNWTSFLNNLTGQAASVAKTAELSSLYQQGALETQGVFGSLMPIVLVVVIGGLAISFLKK